jgi:hypothetical protein
VISDSESFKGKWRHLQSQVALSESRTVVTGCSVTGAFISHNDSSTGVRGKECGASMAGSSDHWGKRKQEAAERQSLKGRVHHLSLSYEGGGKMGQYASQASRPPIRWLG